MEPVAKMKVYVEHTQARPRTDTHTQLHTRTADELHMSILAG